MTSGDITRITNLQSLMSPAIRNRFLEIPMHQQITEEINFVNQAGIEIFDQVSCYRVELGQTLQQLLECFSVIFLKQYEVFNMTENEKDKACVDKKIDLDRQDEEVTGK